MKASTSTRIVHKIDNNEFLLEGTKGVNTGKSFLKSNLLIALFVTVFTIVPFVLFQVFGIGKGIIDFVNTGGGGFELTINIKTAVKTAAGTMMIFVLINSSILGLAFGAIIAEKFIHKRSIQRMFSLGKFNYKALYFGLIAWTILLLFSSFVDVFVLHENYVFNWDINKWLIFLPVVLVLTPLQCISEEIFFRTYLMRLIYTRTQNTIAVIFTITVIFALLHLPNILLVPEGNNLVSFFISLVSYLAISYLLTYLTYVSQGLELSIGIHIANNIICFIVINSMESFTGFIPSIFDVKSTNIYWGCISLILSSLILIAVYSKLKNKLK